uniref:Uncharacterized protein n=1 Tax=Leersia perrieri TaxID=77586 RepID=A0A0D9W3B9_9ORYZ
MDYPISQKPVKRTRNHQDNEEEPDSDRLVGAIISNLEASITLDGEDSYSASEPDDSRAIYTVDGGNDTASTSATPMQRLAAIQQILNKTPFDAAENP